MLNIYAMQLRRLAQGTLLFSSQINNLLEKKKNGNTKYHFKCKRHFSAYRTSVSPRFCATAEDVQISWPKDHGLAVWDRQVKPGALLGNCPGSLDTWEREQQHQELPPHGAGILGSWGSCHVPADDITLTQKKISIFHLL